MRRLYGRIREAFGWSNRTIDEQSVEDAEEIVRHWNEEPPVGALLRSYFGIEPSADVTPGPSRATPPAQPKSLSEDEWKRLCAEEAALAARHGVRSPWA